MPIKAFDYFILSSILRGYPYRVIAQAIQFSESAVGQRMMEWRKRYGVKKNYELFDAIFKGN